MPVLAEVKIVPQPLGELWRKLRKEISRKDAKNAEDK
jgi:hypothetical protein